MQRVLVCLVLALILCGGQAMAGDISIPPELSRTAPEAARLAQEASDSVGLLEGTLELIQEGLCDARKYILAGARSAAIMMAGIVLLGMVESFDEKGTLSRYTTITGTLWITAVFAGEAGAMIGLGEDTILRVSEFSKLLLPALAASTAAMGGATAASIRQVGTVFFTDILLTLIERLLMPMLYLYIGTAAAAAVMEGGALESIGTLIKKVITWSLSVLLILFTTYLTVSGAVAGAADAQAVRLAKSAVSAAVPVVGGILAEAAESVLAGAGLLRSMIGAFGAVSVLTMCLVPFLRLGIQYIMYQAAGFVAQAAGPRHLTKLLTSLGDAFALVLAMTGASALLLIISLVSTLTVVTA